MKRLLVVFIAVVILVALWARGKTPTEIKTNQVNSWKTYQSSQHKLSFKYPPDWSFQVVRDEANFLSLNLKKEDSAQEKVSVYEEEMVPSYSISVSVEDNSKKLSAKELYLDNFIDSARKDAEENIRTVQVGDKEGIEYPEGAAPASGPATAVLVTTNDKIYRFTYSALAHQETHEKHLGEFRQILEKVSFLD